MIRVLLERLAGLMKVLLSAWCAAALYYAPAGPHAWTLGLATFYVIALAAIQRQVRRPAVRRAALVTAWGGVVVWFLLVCPPSRADWLPESQVAPQVEVTGDQVIVRGIRDFHWRSATDFEARWVERTYQLSRLRSVDFFLSFWGPQWICHTFVSFGFERPDRSLEYVAVSIEVRKYRGQTYSAPGSAFRQYSLNYIWALETDVIRVRTNFRGEQVYRYRVRLAPAALNHIFLRYLEETRRLYAHPRWYNAVTDSCGVDILRTVWGDRIGVFPTFQQLFNGLWEKQAYDAGRLDHGLPFEQLRERANISQAAQRATSANFSEAIRQNTVWLGIQVESP